MASYKDVPKYRRSVVVPSMFPSGRSYSDATDSSNLITEPEEKHENGRNADLEDAVHSTGNSIPSVDVLEEEVSDFPLERCMRIVPHDQNTGAFFIAVFQKNSPLPGAFIFPKALGVNLTLYQEFVSAEDLYLDLPTLAN